MEKRIAGLVWLSVDGKVWISGRHTIVGNGANGFGQSFRIATPGTVAGNISWGSFRQAAEYVAFYDSRNHSR